MKYKIIKENFERAMEASGAMNEQDGMDDLDVVVAQLKRMRIQIVKMQERADAYDKRLPLKGVQPSNFLGWVDRILSLMETPR